MTVWRQSGDSLETVKNKGRQDVHDIWKIETWKIS